MFSSGETHKLLEPNKRWNSQIPTDTINPQLQVQLDKDRHLQLRIFTFMRRPLDETRCRIKLSTFPFSFNPYPSDVHDSSLRLFILLPSTSSACFLHTLCQFENHFFQTQDLSYIFVLPPTVFVPLFEFSP